MYDAIIVGARCAGASLAIFLGQAGYRVLLIDKYAMPGPTLSTHIIGEIDVYERLGILDSMDNAGAPAISRMRVDQQGTVLEAPLVVTPRVIGLRRELLDRMLLDAAEALPTVDIMLKTEVTEVIAGMGVEPAQVICRSRLGSGESVRLSTRVIIGADGRNSTIAGLVKATATHSVTYSHAVCYFYAEAITALPQPTVEWYWHQDGLAIINPIDNDRHCVAVMLPAERMAAWRTNLKDNALEWLCGIDSLAPRFMSCRLDGQVRGLNPIQGYIRQPYGTSWALVGDAGAHLHPVSGVGIDNAVCSAEYLSQALHLYFDGAIGWNEAMASYKQQRDERILPQYDASQATLSKALEPVDAGQMVYLNMLCTFPSLAKSIGQRAETIYNELTKEVTMRAGLSEGPVD